MEVDYKRKNLDDVKVFLEEIGEDPQDYSDKQLLHMLEEGF